MTPDRITELAQQAGATRGTEGLWLASGDDLARFADAVLEEAAKVCEHLDDGVGPFEVLASARDCARELRDLKGKQ